MTDTSDDRQPGRSEYVERKEVTVHKFPDADASPPRGIGGSGAGSTAVTLDLSEFAQHVVTSEWLAEVKAKFTRLQMDLAQSRATEAELRARVERRDAVVEAVRSIDPKDRSFAMDDALAALDAAEQPK